MAKKKEEPKNNNKILSIFFLIVFVIAIVAIFGDKGLVEVYSLKDDKETALEDNKFLNAENEKIKEEITRLETDNRYIAEIAKKDLGMVGADEVIYIVNDK